MNRTLLSYEFEGLSSYLLSMMAESLVMLDSVDRRDCLLRHCSMHRSVATRLLVPWVDYLWFYVNTEDLGFSEVCR